MALMNTTLQLFFAWINKKISLFVFLCFSTLCFANQSPQFSGNIFFVGDSHIGEFAGLTGVLRQTLILPVNRAGRDGHPGTMYVTVRDNAEGITDNIMFNLINDGDALLFSFGHVDVNWLFRKQVHIKKRSLDEVIETLVGDYLDLISRISSKNVIIIVYNVTPPSNNAYNPPYNGSLSERVLYTRKMNTVLSRECSKRKMEFLDVYDDYCDVNGMLRIELSDGNHHIQNNHVLLMKLWDILNKYIGKARWALEKAEQSF